MTEFIPSEFFLSQNYPNPFKESTKIKFCVPFKTTVQITVYNSNGELIEKLVDGVKNPGSYEVVFKVVQSNDGGSSSVEDKPEFLYRLEAIDYRCEKKMELIK